MFVLLPLAGAAVVFLPITRGYFFSDDFLNLFHIANERPLRYLFTPNGGHILLSRNAVFWLTRQVGGTTPGPYYWTVFLAHLINVGLLFYVLRRWTDTAGLAAFGAGLWGTSPVHEGTLGWYAVFGHVMAATALLAILAQASRPRVPSRAMLGLWYALALIGATSFGTGLAVALALPLVLRLILPPPPGRRGWPLASLIIAVPLLYVGSLWVYAWLSGGALDLATSYGALLSDWLTIPTYAVRLVAFAFTRLLLGFYSPAWATPDVWLASFALFAVVTIAVAMRSTDAVRRRLAACGLLLLACYGVIALGRGSILARMPPEMVAALTRYHYVGQLILTLMLCLVIRGVGGTRRAVGVALLVWSLVVVAGFALYAKPIDEHRNAREQTAAVLDAIRSAIDATPPGQTVSIASPRFTQMPILPALFPGWAAVFTIFFPDNTVDGRPVQFIVAEAPLKAFAHGRRTRTLLVPAPAR